MHATKNLSWGFTLFFAILMFFSTALFLFNHEESLLMFQSLGVPPGWIYPIALFQVLGAVVLLSNVPFVYKKWSYLTFTAVLGSAILGHAFAGDGQFWAPLMALLVMSGSYFFNKGIYLPEPAEEES